MTPNALRPLYNSRTNPVDWPQKADSAIYESYAELSKWHIEEAATLAAGYMPRAGRFLDCFPMDNGPIEKSSDPGAQTWGELMAGVIGEIISTYARARGVRNLEFSPEQMYVTPIRFMHFARKAGIPMLQHLSDAVAAVVDRRSVHAASESASTESHKPCNAAERRRAAYKASVEHVASDAAKSGHRITVNLLHQMVERSMPSDASLSDRQFRNYLTGFRRDPTLGPLLDRALRQPGRPVKTD